MCPKISLRHFVAPSPNSSTVLIIIGLRRFESLGAGSGTSKKIPFREHSISTQRLGGWGVSIKIVTKCYAKRGRGEGVYELYRYVMGEKLIYV